MKSILFVLTISLLVGCVSVDLPGVVTDAAKVTKDTYKSVTGKKGEAEGAGISDMVSNTYIGQDSQTAAEVKQQCINEAAAKLFKAAGKEVPYTVTENTITSVSKAVAATCKIAANKPASPQAGDKQ